AIRSNALEGIDLVAAKTSTELQFMTAANPAQRTGNIKRILVRVARPGDGIADGGIPAHLNERRSGGRREGRLVFEAQARRRVMIDAFAKKKLVPQEGE